VRISQYVYFGLWSETIPASEMTAVVGLEPDDVQVRGSWQAEPPIPRGHYWRIECRERGLCVDEQMERVLARISGHATAIRSLVDTGDVRATLEVVRNFNDENGEEDRYEDYFVEEGGDPKEGGQHYLLGWALAPEHMQLLLTLGAHLDVDEYG
jgi:hypothetical protein